jgi:hypothetical protein
MTPQELDRCATVAALLRPEWPLGSLKTWFVKFSAKHAHRAYIDTLHAIVACYLDPATTTPARLAENGPWWRAAPNAQPERKITMGTDAQLCRQCHRVLPPPGEEEHDCRKRGPSEAAKALLDAAKARAAAETDRIRREGDEAAAKARQV